MLISEWVGQCSKCNFRSIRILPLCDAVDALYTAEGRCGLGDGAAHMVWSDKEKENTDKTKAICGRQSRKPSNYNLISCMCISG